MKPEDYYLALGKVAFAIGRLEECFIVFTWSLSETNKPEELKVKLIWDGFAKNIKALRKLVKERFSKHYQDRILPIIDHADDLRKKRNENFHALWQVMVDAHSGEFKHVARFRQTAPKGATKPKLDVTTPSDAELTSLAAEIAKCATELERAIKDSFDMDVKVQRWRAKQGF
jgi:hypothetical protein